MDLITISVLQTGDIDTLLPLAHRIWHAHYPGIITVEQIDYMLARSYTREIIRAEIEQQGISWLIIRDGAAMIGFISAGPYGAGAMKLHKLYLLPEYHGTGIGARALAEVEKLAKQQKASRLILNVNIHNHKAIAAYRRAGWDVAEKTIVDIGGGYVMDDYIMSKLVT